MASDWPILSAGARQASVFFWRPGLLGRRSGRGAGSIFSLLPGHNWVSATGRPGARVSVFFGTWAVRSAANQRALDPVAAEGSNVLRFWSAAAADGGWTRPG